MKKKVFIFSVAITLMVSLVGCGEQRINVAKDSLAEVSTETTDVIVEAVEELLAIEESKENEFGETEPVEENEEVESKKSELIEENEEVESKKSELIEESKEVIFEKPEIAEEPKMDEEKEPEAPPQTKDFPEDSAPSPAPHTCIWDDGKVSLYASCNSEGVMTYTCTGCGSTRTESIAMREHVFEKTYWPSMPDCMGAAHYYLICNICGADGGEGTEPALEHTPVATEMRHGNCTLETVISYDCSSCGSHIRDESHTEPNEHEWATGQGEAWNEEKMLIETITITYCTRCGRHQ